MHRMPGRAAVFAVAGPLTATIASAVAVTGLLVAPAPASLAAASAGHPAALPIAATRPGATRSHDAASSAGVVTGVLHTITGAPAAGLCITAAGNAGQAEATVVKPGLNKSAESVSGTSGGYVLHGLAPGTYKEIFSLGCGNHGNFAVQWWKHSTDRRHSKNLMLKGQRQLSGIDASLRPGAVVTGTGAGNAKRTPLANVCVFSVSNAALNEPESVTGTHGRYKLIGLSTGTYTIGYQPPCGRRFDTGFLSARRHLRVTEGRTMRGVNVALTPTSGLSGTVTDIHGQPLGGVCVTMDGSGYRATTKADGFYSVKGIRPGSYSVRFAGGCGNKPSIVPQFYNGMPDADAATRVTFKPGKVTSGIDATMQPGGIITGLITDSAGHPLPHVCAGISGESESESGGVVRSNVRTGDKGRYEIKNVVPGPWRLALGCEAGPNALDWFQGQTYSTRASLLSVGPGVTVTVNAALSLAGSISGKVTSSAGPTAGRVCVSAEDPATGQFVEAGGNPGFADRKGQFHIEGLAPGKYLVQFIGCGPGTFAEQYFGGTASARSATPVTVRAGKTTSGINAHLNAGHTLSGRVTDTSGKPVGPVCVTALNLAGRTERFGRTTSPGRYELTGLATGTYAVTFRPCSASENLGAVTARRFTIKASHPAVTLNAALPVAGATSGRVTASGHTHLATGICVAAVSDNLRHNLAATLASAAAVRIRPDGSYAIPHLAPGVYKLYFNDLFCSGGQAELAAQWYHGRLTEAAAGKVTVVTGKTTKGVDASLQPFGTISGTVTTTAHAPVGGECVVAVPQSTDPDPLRGVTQPTETAISAHTGGYSLIGLQPGQYKIEFTTGCGASGFTTQWWDGVSSADSATVVFVPPGAEVGGIDATLHS